MGHRRYTFPPDDGHPKLGLCGSSSESQHFSKLPQPCVLAFPSFSVRPVPAIPPIRLSQRTLEAVAERGLPVPDYDRGALQPRILHIGVGGFHRAHLALYTHELAVAGSDWGIVGAGLLPHDCTIAEVLAEQDNLYVLTEKGNGEPTPQVIGSIVGVIFAPDDDTPFADAVSSPTTAIISLTITEAGYTELSNADRAGGKRTTLDRLAAALDQRRITGGGPVTILSCDNLPGNGTVARVAILAAARRISEALAVWVETTCSFPNSMVDRITPATSQADRDWLLQEKGIIDRWPVVAEPFRQWVIEDHFVAGRPRWEDVGALFTDRVHDWELYKLRMLNASHSCMAYLSALAGIVYVDESMAIPAVRTFLEGLLAHEAIPTLTEIVGHPREQYAATVLDRFTNTGVRDQIARLCIDGSAKFPTFLLPTIERQLVLGGPIERATMALAGWARYLGVTPHDEQSHDTSMPLARVHAAAALADPVAFLDYAQVFPDSLRHNDRFRTTFAESYRMIVAEGPLTAMTSVA
jgi:mannitol 2-dehydrogenase